MPPFDQASAQPKQPPRRAADELFEQLATEEAALEPVAFEELAAAVDGQLDESEALLWEERVARDPLLARRVADLEQFRDQLERPAARLLSFRGPSSARRWLGWAAAAAAALVVAIGLRAGSTERPAAREALAVPLTSAPASEPSPLFADGFEAGDVSSWSAVSSSG